MADIKFTCPQCQQAITADELWCGHQIQCPGCQGNLTVPPKPEGASAAPAPAAAPAENSLVPKPPAATKLSIGQAHKKPETAAAAPQRSVPIRNLTPPPTKKKSPLGKIAIIGAVVVAVGAGGYFGYDWYAARQKAKAEAEAAAQAEQAKAAAEAAKQAEAAKPEAKPALALPPAWTLDLAEAKIPQGRANGSIAGTNFVVETARFDTVGSAQVLRLLQGAVISPDREFLIYLHLKPGEKLGGQSFNIAADTKSPGMPSVIKRWKPNPKYAPTTKSFANGYVMKLELGQAAADGSIPGKIFLAVPDKEQSVVGGSFKAGTAPVDPNAQYAQPQQQAPAVDPATAAQRAAFDRRYGIRR